MTSTRTWLALLALLATPTVAGHALAKTTAKAPARAWEYYYFLEPQSLTLDTFRLAVWDETPASSGSAVSKLRADQGTVPTKNPTGDMGGGWTLLNLEGTPQGGDLLAVEELVEEIANDPTGDEVASPVLLKDGLTLIATPRIHVGFDPSVPLATVQQALAGAGLGAILVSDWIRPNVFAVEANTRSGTVALDRANALLLQRSDVYFATVNWTWPGSLLRLRPLQRRRCAQHGTWCHYRQEL